MKSRRCKANAMARHDEDTMAQGPDPASHQVTRELLDAVLLALVLQHGPLHCYALVTLSKRRLGPGWSVPRRTAYRTMERLEERGLVSSSLLPEVGVRREHKQRRYAPTSVTESAVEAWVAIELDRAQVHVFRAASEEGAITVISLEEPVDALGPHLVSTADRISARLGYQRDDELELNRGVTAASRGASVVV